MSFLAIAIILFASIAVTVQRGPAATFAYVFLPVALLLSSVPAVSLPILPDMSSMHAVTYGVLLGMLIVGKLPAFRIHPIDWLVVLLSITTIITGYVNGNLWTIVSSCGSETLHWLMPYYMARLAFTDVTLRRHMALILSAIAVCLAAASVVEWRLRPLIVAKILNQLNLSNVDSTFVQGRFGFFRAMVTGEHPIDFGNMGILLCALIPALAVTSGLGLRDNRIRFGTIAAAGMLMTSMSFSSYSGAILAIVTFLGLRYVYRSEILLVPGILAMFVAGFVATSYLLDFNLATLAVNEESAQIEGSFYTRVEIIQKTWSTYGESAGFFGYGDKVDGRMMMLKSVDNSYMLFLIRRGWAHLITRMLVAIAIGVIGTRMLLGQRGESARFPTAAIVAALVGTLVAMYTVWFGFIYAVLWTCMVGMLVSMRQVMLERTAAAPVPVEGFEPAFPFRSREQPPLRPSPRPLIARAGDLR